ncbi:MAG: 6-bladed beta-propeller [Bacteroidota bacterium]
MKMNQGFILKLLLTGTLVILILDDVSGQEPNPAIPSQEDRNYSIQWVSQYPAIKDNRKSGHKERKSRQKRNWFTDLIFGKKADDLVKPMSVVAINPDTFWVADQGTGSMLQVFNQVGEITQFRNKPVENIPSIVGSCFIPGNKILFTDSKLNQIFRFNPAANELQLLNDSITLEQPTGIAYSAVNRQIWVVETKAHRLAVLDANGELIKHVGGRGNAPGAFNFPTYLWIDQSGMVYVVDAMNFRIQIFDRNGEYLSSFGKIGDASGYFSRPKGVATDSFGHIYVSDALFHVVQVFDRTGKLLYTFGTQGQEKEEFWMPTGIYIDKENFIYIADSYNSRIQVFQLNSED